MDRKPLLIFPRPTHQSKTSKPPGRGNNHFPAKDEQITRLDEKITELDRVLNNEAAYLSANPNSLVAEMILVLEIAGDINNFFSAVSKTPEMEFLGEYQSEIDPDNDFYLVDKRGNPKSSKLDTRLFLTMTNQQGLRELQRYWVEFKKAKDVQDFERGTTKFRTIFEQLKDIRPYSIQDRLKDTGLEEYLDEMRQLHSDNVRFEIELAFKNNSEKDERAYSEVVQLIQANGGEVIAGSRIYLVEINYHAFIANAPLACFENLSDSTNISFLKSHQILFFRPVGQSIIRFSEEVQILNRGLTLPAIQVEGEPVVALFDGLPLENHVLLNGRLSIDDPEDFTRNYLAETRVHGTSMACLILNGDLSHSSPELLNRPIYVRPIMRPQINSFGAGESLPDDILPVDLIHRAVVRMFEGENGQPPAAPNVKIINFSIGDPFRPFQTNISTWAKLIDWLSYKYNVLFIVSAGNKVENVELDLPEADFNNTAPEVIQQHMLNKIIDGNFDRKILTPAESINSITIGSSHHDLSIQGNFPNRRNLFVSSQLPSPVSRMGFGYNKSIKPDILMPGGIKLYRKAPVQPDRSKTLLNLEVFPSLPHPPGNLVALPGSSGINDYTGYSCGTSNATALTTHLAARLYEMLIELNNELEEGNRIDEKYFTVILKSLLVHGASWGEAQNILEGIIRNLPGVAANTVKKNLFPYIGYGCVDSEKILYCTDHRVTLIGFGELTKADGQNAHLYSFPLPPSIASKTIEKKLAISLAWFTPLNFRTSKYRKAHLFFDTLEGNGHLSLKRLAFDFKAAQKGTLQHDILTGNLADAFIDGSVLNIKVNCREDASGLSKHEAISYGLAVTLEVQENVETIIYEEIQTRLQQRIRPRI
ncbi:MAG: hypothetical protein COW65_15910 [Cytophagales bacterium CG18_big_fil_WC_8_21_14_2_50_42_9]|nr:MAG: hypothetical protein COW65_15910 [Cytophagales bacterium CG18_big_fil_WC_8_21_14_2_50_42_9]